MRGWVYNPHVGGTKIPPVVQASVRQRILKYAAKHHAGKFIRIEVRFHGALCYVDAYTEPDLTRGSKPPDGQFFSERRRPRHAGRGFRNVGPVLLSQSHRSLTVAALNAASEPRLGMQPRSRDR